MVRLQRCATEPNQVEPSSVGGKLARTFTGYGTDATVGSICSFDVGAWDWLSVKPWAAAL